MLASLLALMRCRSAASWWAASKVVVAKRPRSPPRSWRLPARAARACGCSVVAVERCVGVVGDAVAEEVVDGGVGADSDEAVAGLDVMVEEGEGFAGFERLEPEGDLAEFGRHRVEVDRVEAVADDVA